jgi:hypothetical protein
VLTQAGHRIAREAARSRAVVLEQAIERLDQASCAQLVRLLETLLRTTPKDQWDGQNLCRLCDLVACNRGAPCPVDVGLVGLRPRDSRPVPGLRDRTTDRSWRRRSLKKT